jgi:hypothetical protein
MKPKKLKGRKLVVNKDAVRTLTGGDLQRAAGGYVNNTGSAWCSSSGPDVIKCRNVSARCVNP